MLGTLGNIEKKDNAIPMNTTFFCSWSGGKDSCLALYYTIKAHDIPKYLFTVLDEEGEYSRSHRIPKGILQQQSRKIGIPITFTSASWEDYEVRFDETLQQYRQNNITYGVFGDIDIEEHREWCERICEKNGIKANHPLWKRSREELIEEFIRLGFKAKIIVTKADKLGSEWLGRSIDKEVIEEFRERKIDICGEYGEYHTLVTDGPLFESGIKVEGKNKVMKDGYWFLDIE